MVIVGEMILGNYDSSCWCKKVRGGGSNGRRDLSSPQGDLSSALKHTHNVLSQVITMFISCRNKLQAMNYLSAK